MSHGYKHFLSNRVEVLYEDLKACLFKETAPFHRRLVIIPSPAMKTWLTVRMAEDPDIGIASGIEFYTLEPGLEAIRAATGEGVVSREMPSSLELTLKISVELRGVVESFGRITPEEQAVWRPVMEYLKVGDHSFLSPKGERRLVSLSETVAHLFKQYGRYGGDMLRVWKEQPMVEWQALLWHSLFHGKGSSWSYPYDLYENHRCKSECPNLSFYLFALSYVSTLQHRFLEQVASVCPIYQYLLSPCALFWSDIRSDREAAHITKMWRQRGAGDDEQQQLEDLLRDKNKLLANFGRLGREMAAHIDEGGAQPEEAYVIAHMAQELEAYEEHLHGDYAYDEGEISLLHAMQTDMVLLRNPEEGNKICLKEDTSIQVHVAPSRMREVEILYDTLMGLIDRHADGDSPIAPSDIVVLAPDISDYEPYIKAVFNGAESKLDCQIMDLKAPSQSMFIRTFLHLLALPSSYWDAKVIAELFESSPFCKKHRFSDDDVRIIKRWIKECGIRWGADSAHRDELLRRDHCEKGMFDNNSAGTWDHGIERLLRSLVLSSEDVLSSDLNVYISQSDLLGKLIFLLRSLREDVKPLDGKTMMTVDAWALYLESLLDSYFSTDHQEPSQIDEERTLRKHLRAIRHAAESVKGKRFPFTTIYRLLMEALMKEEVCYRESHLQSVKFCSMLPMRAVPARVVALIGMADGDYPKQDLRSSLNAMARYSDVDYCPSQTDYDRYLFLEILLSARDHMIMSYPAQGGGDDQEVPPSLLITELLSYLDQSFTVGDKKPSECCLYRHPYHSFDAEYFTKESKIRSYTPSNYMAAQHFYHPEERRSKPFLKDYSMMDTCSSSECFVVDVKSLKALLKSPLKTFFNKTLGIYINGDEDREIKVEENFALHALDSYAINKTALKNPIDHVMKVADAEGKLPFGLFKNVAMTKLYGQFQQQEKILKEANISREDFFDIELSEYCEALTTDDDGTVTVPPLQVSIGEEVVTIVGRIHEVTPQGLVAFVKDSAEAMIAVWPEYLVLCALIDQHRLPIKRQVLPLKATKFSVKADLPDDPFHLLSDVIKLYLLSLKNASPLFPKWLPNILGGDASTLESLMRDQGDDSFNPVYDQYMKWIVERTHAPDADRVIESWKPHADSALGPFFTTWYPTKKKEKK